MAVTLQRCIDAMSNAAGRPLTDDEVERVAVRLQERVERLRRSRGSASDAQLLREASAELRQEANQEAALLRRSALFQMRAYAALQGAASEWGTKEGGDFLRALLVGTNTPGKPARFSIDYRGKAIADEYFGNVIAGLRGAAPDDRLVTAFMRGTHDQDVAREMWALPPGHAGAGRAAVTGNADALAIATILHNAQEGARLRANRGGAWIDALPGYVVRQSHDPLRIKRMGFDAWRAMLEPLLDDSTFERAQARVDQVEAEKAAAAADLADAKKAAADDTMPDDRRRAIEDRRRRAEARIQAADLALKDLEFSGRADDRGEFLQAVYNDIVSGRTLLPQANGAYVAGAGGSSNVAMKVSRERVLNFKDADAWWSYHQQAGRPGNLATAAVEGLQRLGRQTALIETLGPNPVANFTRLRAHLELANRTDPDALVALRSSAIDQQLQWVTGASRGIDNPNAAAIGSVLRGWNNLTKLGFMLFSSVTDTVGLAAEAKFQGKGWLAGYRQSLEDLMHGRGDEERRLISDLAGAGLEGMTGAVGSRFGAIDSVPGFMAWGMRKMYALNVGAWWTDAHKIGATMMQMRGWAIDRARAFADLGEEQKRLFGLYGIGETDWNLLRANQERNANGRGYLVPADLREMPTAEVSRVVGKPLTDGEALRVLDGAGDRFATLLADRADYAVPTPGGREYAAMYGGHKPGSAWGEALRLFWQFKQFPVSVLTKPLAQMAANAESRVAAATSIGAFVLQSAAMGYVGMSLKDIIKNKEPRPADKWETWLASLAQGGGLGIYGDYLFGDFDRFGHSPAENFLGPTFGGLAPDVIKLWSQAVHGDMRASDALRFTVDKIPFANLFYVKPVLDTLILSELYERLNPGYRRRAEAEMQRTEGRGFLIHP